MSNLHANVCPKDVIWIDSYTFHKGHLCLYYFQRLLWTTANPQSPISVHKTTYTSAIRRVQFQYWKLQDLWEVIQQSFKCWCCSSLQHNCTFNSGIPILDDHKSLWCLYCHPVTDLCWLVDDFIRSPKLKYFALSSPCAGGPGGIPWYLPPVHFIQV